MNLRKLLVLCVIASISVVAQGAEKLWSNDRITPDQPFKAVVVGVGGNSPWSGGVDIYLHEIGGTGRYCKVFASRWKGPIYNIIEEKDFNTDEMIKSCLYLGRNSYSVCFFNPSIKIEDFVWCHMSMFPLGSYFGEKDTVAIGRKAEQAAVDLP